VNIEKSEILAVLRSRDQHMRAEWVDREFPDHLDSVRDASLLVTLGITKADLAGIPSSST
jgi:hypothetical protein